MLHARLKYMQICGVRFWHPTTPFAPEPWIQRLEYLSPWKPQTSQQAILSWIWFWKALLHLVYFMSIFISFILNYWLLAATAQWYRARLRMDDRVSESRQGLGIFLLTTAFKTALKPTQPPMQGVPGALFPGVKRPEREADHTSSSTEVKSAWRYTPTPSKSSWCAV
jgi:hypothetical protein